MVKTVTKRGTRILGAVAAIAALAFGGGTAVADPGDGGGGEPAPLADVDYPAIFAGSSAEKQGFTPNDQMATNSLVIAHLKAKIPNDAVAGEVLTLRVPEQFNIQPFTDLEAKTDDGVPVATLTRVSTTEIEFTLESGVETHHGATATVSFSVAAKRSPSQYPGWSGNFNVYSPTNQPLMEDLPVAFMPPGKLGTTLTLKPETFLSGGENQIGFQLTGAWIPGNPDVQDTSTVKFTFKPATETEGAVMDCTYPPRVFTAINNSTQDSYVGSARIIACSLDEMVAGLPDGLDLNGVNGFMILPRTIVDRPQYKYTYDLVVESDGKTVVERTASGLSPKLDGVADGKLRPAKTKVTKVANPSPVEVGQELTYTIKTENTEQFLTAYKVVTTDTLPAGVTFISASDNGEYSNGKITWLAKDIAPGESLTYTVKVKVTDTVGDSIENTVSNKGENTCYADDTTGSVCTANVITPVAKPAVELEKSSTVEDTNGNTVLGDAGDTIKYTFLVKNTGNTVIKSAELTDVLLGLSDYECLAKPLPAGESVECADTDPTSFSHVITEEEAEAGEVENHATITVPGAPPGTGTTTTPTYAPGFDFEKKVLEVKDKDGKAVQGGKPKLGGTIHYGFTVKNTGNMEIKEILISDSILGVTDVSCLAEGATLGINETVDCVDNPKYTYTVTEADAVDGKVHNVATATAPGLPEGEGETTTPVLPTPVPTELPKTGASGIFGLVGAGALMTIAGVLALRRRVGVNA